VKKVKVVLPEGQKPRTKIFINVFKFFALMAFAVVVGVGFWRGVSKSDLLKVQNIMIEGASKQTEERIRKNSGIIRGESFWKIPVQTEAARIKKDGWVDAVEVSRRFPGSVVISVREKKPVAITSNGRGQFKFVDSDSNIIDNAQPDQIGDYPVLTGPQFEGNKDLRAKALDLLKSLPDQGALSKSDVSELQFRDDHGFQLTLSQSGTLVELGKDNIPLHVDRARRVVQYLNQHGINATHVDSDYAKKVLVKVRKDR